MKISWLSIACVAKKIFAKEDACAIFIETNVLFTEKCSNEIEKGWGFQFIKEL